MMKDNSKMNRIEFKMKKSVFEQRKVIKSADAYDVIRKFFGDEIEIYESFFILLLNRSNTCIGYAKISQGGCVGTVIDVKIITKYVIDSFAQSVILAHNHPSGNTTPSNADKLITEKIRNALRLFDCEVVDHLILTQDQYYSFSDEGIL
jgi:DNA repair protein RadC